MSILMPLNSSKLSWMQKKLSWMQKNLSLIVPKKLRRGKEGVKKVAKDIDMKEKRSEYM